MDASCSQGGLRQHRLLVKICEQKIYLKCGVESKSPPQPALMARSISDLFFPDLGSRT
ncbi:hypothetical protein J6590_087607 [Homalodisca vitripennis]|nr:hypothetical protein J6590_087607 [Homalodisca vitripennis]